MSWLIDLLTNEEGQGLLEYILLLVLMVIVVVSALTIMGPKLANHYGEINNTI